MNNFEVTSVDGSKHWISRSVAVAGFVFIKRNKQWYVLANKRGSGTPDFQGYWNCPCGYLDYDETLAQACAREIREECNIKIAPKELRFCGVDDNPNSNKQNITARFFTVMHYDYVDDVTCDNDGGEVNEVSNISWIPLNSLDKYKWAFGHQYLITEIFDNYIR